ncbi:MAG: hypothetical protein ACTS4V_00085 [Candidatus Hodgkinia cicadicola]
MLASAVLAAAFLKLLESNTIRTEVVDSINEICRQCDKYISAFADLKLSDCVNNLDHNGTFVGDTSERLYLQIVFLQLI